MDIVIALFTLAGGLGFFLYGMSLMGGSLKKVAGGKLETILKRLSSTPLRGILLGTAVTAAIQSSSATTVMVVGFVNSGLMNLSQAIGVVMGSNIGTTVTGWLLSLSGIEGGTSFLTLLKPSSFAPLIVFVGAVIFLFSKDAKRRLAATALFGFGTLLMGMTIMSDAMTPFAESEAFLEALTVFSNPFLGLLIGTVLTAVIQSSSATVGILQALSLTGAISYGTAIPLIVGINIGACTPILISGIGASTEGKRTSAVYLYFNLFAAVLFMVPFYIIHAVHPFAFMDLASNPLGIAMFNTAFMLGTAIILFPFLRPMEKLVCLTVKEKKAPVRDDIEAALDPRFLSMPDIALEQCRSVVNTMRELSVESITSVIGLLNNYDRGIASKIEKNEETVDECEDKLGTYLVKLSGSNLNKEQSRETAKLLHAIGDFERISDHAINLTKTAAEIDQKKITFSKEAEREFAVISSAVREILSITSEAFRLDDAELAGRVEPLEQVIDLICAELKSRHISRLQNGVCGVEQGFVWNDMISNYGRISDHCSNIAVTVIRLKNEVFDTHEYLNKLKTGDDESFKANYNAYRQTYFGAL